MSMKVCLGKEIPLRDQDSVCSLGSDWSHDGWGLLYRASPFSCTDFDLLQKES